jgi:hypothetical protein
MLADINKNWSESDLAYAAGFLDADGCVTVGTGRRTVAGYMTYKITVNVGQKTPDVPAWFSRTFGGSFKIQKRSSQPGAERFCDMFVWALYGHNLETFLRGVIPYLKTKQLRAMAALDLCLLHSQRGKGGRYKGNSRAIPREEALERERLAIVIRNENMRTSSRCKPIVPMVM